jgi:hypothetical protein
MAAFKVFFYYGKVQVLIHNVGVIRVVRLRGCEERLSSFVLH